MKCPICGNEEFIDSPFLPFGISGDAKLITVDCSCLCCTTCGYTVFINKGIAKFVYEQREAVCLLNIRLKEKEERLLVLRKSSNDMSKYKQQLAKCKKQLKLKQEWGEDNKSTRSLKESISELNEIIERGVDGNSLSAIRTLEHDIEEIKKEIDKLKTTISSVKFNAIDSRNLSGKDMWDSVTCAYQKYDGSNNNTISISKELINDRLLVEQLIAKIKANKYRPFGYSDSAQTIIVKTKEEKEAFCNRPYKNVVLGDTFLIDNKDC